LPWQAAIVKKTAMIDAGAMDREALAALLRWYAEMGVDCAMGETPVDRFEQSLRPPPDKRKIEEFAEPTPAEPPQRSPLPQAAPNPPPRSSKSPPQAVTPAPAAAHPYTANPHAAIPHAANPHAAMSHDAAAASAREQAAGARTLQELRERLEAFDNCALKHSATRLVFADGAPDAKIMIVGEGPGADEDRIGRPFVGRAGQLLDKMLAAIGLDRSKVYIANVVPWRPPGNRTPTPQELALCLPFIRRQIELVEPEFLVLLGASAAQTLLNEKEGIMRLRGHWRDYHGGEGTIPALTIPALPMLHPAYLLRAPLKKAQAWRDLRLLRHALDKAGLV
jgi:DNA polymerase